MEGKTKNKDWSVPQRNARFESKFYSNMAKKKRKDWRWIIIQAHNSGARKKLEGTIVKIFFLSRHL